MMATSAPAAIVTGSNDVESSVRGSVKNALVELVAQLPEGLRLPCDITITSLHSPLLYGVFALI